MIGVSSIVTVAFAIGWFSLSRTCPDTLCDAGSGGGRYRIELTAGSGASDDSLNENRSASWPKWFSMPIVAWSPVSRPSLARLRYCVTI